MGFGLPCDMMMTPACFTYQAEDDAQVVMLGQLPKGVRELEGCKLVLVWWRVRLLELGLSGNVPSGSHSYYCTGTSCIACSYLLRDPWTLL